jgi:ubiquinone/menaquinone biosynthesis C-methylase UbiE
MCGHAAPSGISYNFYVSDASRIDAIRGACMSQVVDFPPKSRPITLVSVDLAAVKARQQAMWASGDFSLIGTTLQLVGETLCESAGLRAGERVLDVACGNGNAALAAARRFCRVVGLDYVPSLLERGRERAAAERLDIEFVEGDAEMLPFPADSFDAVLSTFGVMFAPNQERAARELTRVVRRGGRIALASWTPEGFVGRMLIAVAKHVPPPAGVASPVYWGNEQRVRELFPNVAGIRAERRVFTFNYESPDHFIDFFRKYYGPTHKAFGALDPAGQAQLARDLREVIEKFRAPSNSPSLAIPAEYLELVIER